MAYFDWICLDKAAQATYSPDSQNSLYRRLLHCKVAQFFVCSLPQLYHHWTSLKFNSFDVTITFRMCLKVKRKGLHRFQNRCHQPLYPSYLAFISIEFTSLGHLLLQSFLLCLGVSNFSVPQNLTQALFTSPQLVSVSSQQSLHTFTTFSLFAKL